MLIRRLTWRGMQTRLAMGALAMGVVLLVGAGAFVLLDGTPGEEVGEYLLVPYMSDEENRVRQHIWGEVYKPALERGRVEEAQLVELQPYLESSQPYFVRDLAISVMGEMIHKGVKMSDASREIIVQSYLAMLQDEEWGLRRLAVSYAIVAGLLQDQRVNDAVRKMADDPHEKVARHVNRIDWTDPKHGG